jgi:hypothetical protein
VTWVGVKDKHRCEWDVTFEKESMNRGSGALVFGLSVVAKDAAMLVSGRGSNWEEGAFPP